jgi:hypothetical protein
MSTVKRTLLLAFFCLGAGLVGNGLATAQLPPWSSHQCRTWLCEGTFNGCNVTGLETAILTCFSEPTDTCSTDFTYTFCPGRTWYGGYCSVPFTHCTPN